MAMHETSYDTRWREGGHVKIINRKMTFCAKVFIETFFVKDPRLNRAALLVFPHSYRP